MGRAERHVLHWRAHDRRWRAGDDLQQNSRLGATMALPVDRHNSVKLYGSTGVSTRREATSMWLALLGNIAGAAGFETGRARCASLIYEVRTAERADPAVLD